MDKRIDAIIALKNPYNCTPLTIEKASFNITPLITKENSPKVKNVIGNEKNCITGLTNVLSKPKINVNINNDLNDPIYILSINLDTMNKEIAFITINNENLFIFINLLSKNIKLYKFILYYTIKLKNINLYLM